MVRKEYYSVGKVKGLVLDLIKQISNDNWKPDYVVGINRGGLTPAVMISHFMNIPMFTLDIQLRDHTRAPESNTMMPLDALEGKQILIVDDINDSGSTFNWLKNDWRQSAMPADARWQNDIIFGHNVRTACLIENGPSEFECNYSGTTINKVDEPQWIVFPWEEWWAI